MNPFAWVVLDAHGALAAAVTDDYENARHDAICCAMASSNIDEWPAFQEAGFRCLRVRLIEVGP